MIGPVSPDLPRSFEEALTSDDPVSRLREAVVRVRADGVDRDILERQLQELREHLVAAGRGDDEDVVLEVMDFLVGWSSAHMRIE